ncbi:MAG: ATP-binding protein [Candidatus Gracilibacteria bacterium]|nr:ATP-binding protein [Candidatus Gracilibacteria bacterium]
MIHSFTFSNFGSFSNEATIDFTWNKKDSVDDTVTTNLSSGINVSKIMTIVGPNASGKSNILRTLSFLKFWIVEAGMRLPPDLPVTHQGIQHRAIPFLYTPNKESIIECVFETKKAQYKIYLAIKGGFASEEVISIRSKTDKRTTWKVLFNRDNLGLNELPLLRKNASIIFLKQILNDAYGKDIVDYWSSVFNKVSSLSMLGEQSFEMNRGPALNVYHSNKESRDFLNELLRKFDTGFSELDFKEIENADGTKGFEPIGKIQRNGKTEVMPFYSDGTLKIIDYAYLIYGALEKGGVLIFDEIDASFHPEIVDAILDLFLSKHHNKHNAQIILTTHNPRILKSLNRYQIQLVEKNKDGESETYRLDDVEGVRVDENYYTRYMAGAYGARPNITL